MALVIPRDRTGFPGGDREDEGFVRLDLQIVAVHYLQEKRKHFGRPEGCALPADILFEIEGIHLLRDLGSEPATVRLRQVGPVVLFKFPEHLQSIVQGRLLEKTLLKRLDVSGPRLFPFLFLLAIGPGGRILRIEEPSGVRSEHLADVALAIRREFANEANGLFVDEPMRGLSSESESEGRNQWWGNAVLRVSA